MSCYNLISLYNSSVTYNIYINQANIISNTCCELKQTVIIRGGEWYLEKRGSRKILAGSQNLGSVFDKSRSLVFSWFAFTFFESRNFSPKSLGLGFLTRISASLGFYHSPPLSLSWSCVWAVPVCRHWVMDMHEMLLEMKVKS